VILAVVVVVTVMIGLALGGSLTRLSWLRLRGWPILVGAVLLQAYAAGNWEGAQAAGVPVRAVIFVATHGVVLAVALANLSIAGMKMVVAGAVANMVALLANGGLMPVSAQARLLAGRQAAQGLWEAGTAVMGSKGVVLPVESANLWPLTDIFVLTPPFPVPAAFSIGDALIAAGIGYLILKTMRPRGPWRLFRRNDDGLRSIF
jgi:hypothetical protein